MCVNSSLNFCPIAALFFFIFFLTVFIELKTSFTMLLKNKHKIQFYLKRKRITITTKNICIYYNNDENNKDAC